MVLGTYYHGGQCRVSISKAFRLTLKMFYRSNLLCSLGNLKNYEYCERVFWLKMLWYHIFLQKTALWFFSPKTKLQNSKFFMSLFQILNKSHITKSSFVRMGKSSTHH
jgi:hypothetical protein